MAAIGTLPVLFATGIHASRPAASAVGKGGLYSCTTHSLVYQTDGSSWTTWATLGSTGSVATDAIWDAAGDMVIGTGADTAGRVAIGSSGKVWQSNGTTASWQTPSGVVVPVTGQATITHATNSTSTSYADVTDAAVTVTNTGGRKVRLTFVGQVANSAGTAEYLCLTYSVDGTNVEGTNDPFTWLCPVSGWQGTVTFEYIVPAATATAGSHTYKLRLRRNSGTNTVQVTASATALAFMYVEEILA